MDDEFNVTYITLDGYVDVDKYRYFYFFIMLTVYILTIWSNFTILYLIWNHKNLHEPMYIFIAGLLLNSVIYSTAITALYPKLLIDVLSEQQVISYSACLFQFFIFYSLSGSEFFLLSAMAYDRYVSICKPLQYPTIMRKNTVSIFLFLAWLVPACQTAVSVILSAQMKLCNFTFKGIFCNNSMYTLHCCMVIPQSLCKQVVTRSEIKVFDFLVPIGKHSRSQSRSAATQWPACWRVRSSAVISVY
ncbi:olfactory receptor 5AC2-like [Symphorus nematophorus]